MCSNLVKNGRRILPYATLPLYDYRGMNEGIWGIGSQYNSRIETLTKGCWDGFTKAIIEVDKFYEGIGLFEDISSITMYLLCARRMNTNQFTIVTKPSKGTIIEPYHNRIPLVLEKPDISIKTGKIIEINYTERLRLVS
jgi:hypothetical protein